MTSDQAEFWDRRYLDEGPVWGREPSPTAVLGCSYFPPQGHILDVGFGYGRDLPFLIRSGFRACGIDLSIAGLRLARRFLEREGVQASELLTGRFEDVRIDPESFDGILSHRVAHLLVTRDAVTRFAHKIQQVLRPAGILSLGARNLHDLTLDEMIRVDDGVYEYRKRPGHQIRYWDEASFRQAFGEGFRILHMSDAVENESIRQPVPCHFTVIIAQKVNGLVQPNVVDAGPHC